MSCEKRGIGRRFSGRQRRRLKPVAYLKASVLSEPFDLVLLKVERDDGSIRGATVERPTLVRPGGTTGKWSATRRVEAAILQIGTHQLRSKIVPSKTSFTTSKGAF